MQLVDASACNLDSSAAVHIFVVMLVVENGVVWVCMIHFELADFLYRHPVEKGIDAFFVGVHSCVCSLE